MYNIMHTIISNTNATLARPIILTIFQAMNVIVQNLQMLNSPIWFNFVSIFANICPTSNVFCSEYR